MVWSYRSASIVRVFALCLVLVLLPIVFLTCGWHPLPTTAVGCFLHTKFHGGSTVATGEQLLGVDAADCLKARLNGRERVILNREQTAAVLRWLNSHADGWVENFALPVGGKPANPNIELGSCRPTSQGSTGVVIYVDDDWVGMSPSKRFQRPICHGEWRELATLISKDGDH
jgi:hypothetical protein